MATTSEAKKLEPNESPKKGSLYICKICGNKVSANASDQQEEKDLICCGEYMSREAD